MRTWGAFLSERLLWIGFGVVLLVLGIFGLALMAPVLGAKPNNIPVALVVSDREVSLPTGAKLHVGAMLKEKLTANTQLPVKWVPLDSEVEALEGIDGKKYYGALVLPSDLSANLMTLATPDPKVGTVRIFINEGLNAQVAGTVKQMLQQIVAGASQELSRQLLAQIGARSPQIPVQTATALLAPIQVQEQVLHKVGANQANGGAPGLLTQLLWMAALAGSAFLFLVTGKLPEEARTWWLRPAQAVIGLAMLAAAVGFLLWMSASWYGMQLDAPGELWRFMFIVAAAFFLLQTALLSWLGIRAMALLVLLMFFSMPIVNMAPEMLPQAAADLLYAWVPFRFAADGLRDTLYFGGAGTLQDAQTVLLYIAVVSLAVLLVAPYKKKEGARPAVQAS